MHGCMEVLALFLGRWAQNGQQHDRAQENRYGEIQPSHQLVGNEQ